MISLFISLIIISHSGSDLSHDLKVRNLKKVRRAASTFTRGKYQIIAIESDEVMDVNSEEWQAGKILTYTHVTNYKEDEAEKKGSTIPIPIPQKNNNGRKKENNNNNNNNTKREEEDLLIAFDWDIDNEVYPQRNSY